METEKFIEAYHASRNGANEFYRHGMVSRFHYSDGVRDCAQAGAYWLLDILATELPALMRREGEGLLDVHVQVAGGKAELSAGGSGDRRVWSKAIDWTDLPDGEWVFYVVDEGARFAMILPTEY